MTNSPPTLRLADTQRKLTLRISPLRVAAMLAALVTCFAAASFVARSMVERHPENFDWRAQQIAQRFFLDGEESIPTWYSAAALLASATLLALIALALRRQGMRDVPYWALLALGLLVLSIDEITNLHELATAPLREWINAGHYAAWVSLLLAMLLGLLLAYAGFLRRLEPATRYLLLLAAAVYVGGAIGCEILSDVAIGRHGLHSLSYIAVSTLEETLEEAGNVVLIYALLRYLSLIASSVRVRL